MTVIGPASASWRAVLTNGNGTVTLTKLTATEVGGTFSFTAPAVAGTTASGTRSVSQGVFDIGF